MVLRRTSTIPRRVPHVPALDGLRGVAIAVVALFHYPSHGWLPGGLFGVGVFFALSGFLITPILMEEHARTGRVDYGRFLWSRGRRLLPALLAFLVVMLLLTAAVGSSGWFTSDPFGPARPGQPVGLGRMAQGIGAALTYTYNGFLAHSVRMPAPLGHLWTLAVEGQFYVLWMLAVPRLARRGPITLLSVTAALIPLSAAAQWVAWGHAGGPNYDYFSTVTNIQQLLTGALLGELYALRRMERCSPRVLKAAALVGGGTLAYLFLEVANVPFKYLGALTVTAVASPLLIAHLADERADSRGKRLLGAAPLRWLGTRSYAVYLWHWPLAEWTNLLPRPWGEVVGLGASLVLAELSWRLVEQPAVRALRRRPAPPSEVRRVGAADARTAEAA